MGLYLGAPGADFSAAAGKKGTQTFPARDALPWFALTASGLSNWWAAEDAATVGSVNVMTDRIASKDATPPTVGTSPAITADSGKAALNFNLAPYMRIAPALVKTAAFTWVFVVKPITLAPAQQCLLGASGGAATGYRIWIKSDGSVFALVNGTSCVSTAGKVTAGNRVIIGVSFNGTQIGFSFNGVFDKYVACTTTPVNESLASIGSNDSSGGQPLNSLFFDAIQFDRDMHAAGNATPWAYVTGQLKTYYGL